MMSGLMKWKKSKNQKDGSKEKAAIIRAILGLGELTEKLDPWLPFPQNSCCFFFGKDRLPIPVGALLFLWENSFLFTGECPYCGTFEHRWNHRMLRQLWSKHPKSYWRVDET